MSTEKGELTKLKIEAFKKSDFTDPVDQGIFNTSMTPEKYTLNFKAVRNSDQAAGTTSSEQAFSKFEPQKMDLNFLFDRTGVLVDYPADPKGISADIEKFKSVIMEFSGDTHKPYYVKIIWGDLIFKGVMEALAIEYKLFNSQGAALRAIAKVSFVGATEKNLRASQENKQSPDMTHYRKVLHGETLPLMTYRIYGDSKYYLEVARQNNLTNFRKLEAGQEIWFPPLQKQS